MKIILVTGGAGFIGSHLCDRLVERGDFVICLDNLLTGSQKNIAHLISKKNFFFINADACDGFSSKKFTKLDEIYHMASPADPNQKSKYSYMAHPFETMRVNTVGTWAMCELAQKHKAKLLFTSTSEVYGDPEVSPQSENYRGNVSCVGPRSVYDEAKRFGETIVSSFVREKKIDARITRIFNTYGPRMNIEEGRAVVHFIVQALKDEPLTVYGDGSQTRSFCYVDDQVEGQILAMDTAGTTGQVFNTGNPQEITILTFAQKIKELVGGGSEIEFTEPLPEDDPKRRRPDISRAKEVLDWEPAILLEDGLQKTIEHFKKTL